MAVVLPAAGQGQSSIDTTVEFGTRVFDVLDDTTPLGSAHKHGILDLVRIPWIKALVSEDPLLSTVSFQFQDKTSDIGTPGWLPDMRSRIHPDPTLPPVFDPSRYEIGWVGSVLPTTRGDVVLFPRGSADTTYVLCPYERSAPLPGYICFVHSRYAPDHNLRLRVLVPISGDVLPDFIEIEARLYALIQCLDVTESKDGTERGEYSPSDLAQGGVCRNGADKPRALQ